MTSGLREPALFFLSVNQSLTDYRFLPSKASPLSPSRFSCNSKINWLRRSYTCFINKSPSSDCLGPRSLQCFITLGLVTVYSSDHADDCQDFMDGCTQPRALRLLNEISRICVQIRHGCCHIVQRTDWLDGKSTTYKSISENLFAVKITVSRASSSARV